MTNIANRYEIRNIGKCLLISAANRVIIHRMTAGFNSSVYTLNIQLRITGHDEISSDKITFFFGIPEHIQLAFRRKNRFKGKCFSGGNEIITHFVCYIGSFNICDTLFPLYIICVDIRTFDPLFPCNG